MTQVRARTAPDGLVPPVRPLRWQRLCLPSFLVAGLTGLIVWVAVDTLLGQGRLGTVLAAGRCRWSRTVRSGRCCCSSPGSSPSRSRPG